MECLSVGRRISPISVPRLGRSMFMGIKNSQIGLLATSELFLLIVLAHPENPFEVYNQFLRDFYSFPL